MGTEGLLKITTDHLDKANLHVSCLVFSFFLEDRFYLARAYVSFLKARCPLRSPKMCVEGKGEEATFLVIAHLCSQHTCTWRYRCCSSPCPPSHHRQSLCWYKEWALNAEALAWDPHGLATTWTAPPLGSSSGLRKQGSNPLCHCSKASFPTPRSDFRELTVLGPESHSRLRAQNPLVSRLGDCGGKSRLVKQTAGSGRGSGTSLPAR